MFHPLANSHARPCKNEQGLPDDRLSFHFVLNRTIGKSGKSGEVRDPKDRRLLRPGQLGAGQEVRIQIPRDELGVLQNFHV